MNAPDLIEGDGQLRWYVLKVQSNRERTIRDSIQRRVRQEGLQHYFAEIIIPTEKVAETRGGKRRVSERKLYPGYIMIKMILNDESWYLIRETAGVGDFTGAAGKPHPMKDDEIQRMLGLETAKEEVVQPKVKIDFAPGDRVKIKEGSFESFEGTVDTVDEVSGRVNVLVEIFGRSTPVELGYWQVEAV
ncbi:MAG: transcription termination/antitermination protein NusG [Planctomycetota bacterium]|nr:transcription termination/antitermination protein NusG [Planctomycetota bacterium]